jgi:SAM-dependent methyltransferase
MNDDGATDGRMKTAELAHIATGTLEHYAVRANAFWQGTRDHDVSQNISALLGHIVAAPPFAILDLGCGPGRDLKTFKDLGHTAVGVEGAAPFVAMARAWSGCQVWHQDFLRLDLPAQRFDGVFANASLFHVPAQELPRVLAQLHGTLKQGGVLFTSNPRGHDDEGWHQGRYGVYWSLDSWRRRLVAAGFVELAHYYRPEGLPLAQQPWLASVWRAASGD